MSNPLSSIAFVTLKAVPAAALAAARNRCGLVGMRTWRRTAQKKSEARGGQLMVGLSAGAHVVRSCSAAKADRQSNHESDVLVACSTSTCK